MPDACSLSSPVPLDRVLSTLFAAVPANVSTRPDALGVGQLVQVAATGPGESRLSAALGAWGPEVVRWTALRRPSPFWMVPQAGGREAELPRGSQFVLVELRDGSVALLAPLISGGFSCCLNGAGSGVELIADSNDSTVVADAVTALFVAVGWDPYALVTESARSVARHLGTTRLRVDKPLPAFVDQFGWCTWDAFYHEVSQEKVLAGLASFQATGYTPGLLVIDDGWQQTAPSHHGAIRLIGLGTNEKFPQGFRPLVEAAKQTYGVKTVLVWHAVLGYWGGLDPQALATYDVRIIPRRNQREITLNWDTVDTTPWGRDMGVPALGNLHRFYHDYHRGLRAQGVDGVKVDTQAFVEAVAQGQGGRAAAMRQVHEALEGSVAVHFQGNLINCMSCSLEMLYGAPASTVTRSSDDFYPTKPASHGLHLYTNALVSLWFGEFIHPDWDMFQSGHATGAFHAAGRAVSGGPIYVSDKPGTHDAQQFARLAFHDGTAARCLAPGRPSPASLFADPCGSAVPLRIFNHTVAGAVVGVFDCRTPATDDTTQVPSRSAIGHADVPDSLAPAVAWVHGGAARLLAAGETVPVALAPLQAEVVTLARIWPVTAGPVAVIGLERLACPGAGIAAITHHGNRLRLAVRDGGTVLLWTAKAPQNATLDDGQQAATELRDGLLRVTIPGTVAREVDLVW